MYITVNNEQYNNIKCTYNALEIIYIGASLTGIEAVSGTIGLYANDGSLMREDDVLGYERTEIQDGRITLTNRPAPQPQPEPPEPEPEPTTDIWAEMADAIKEGVNGVDK